MSEKDNLNKITNEIVNATVNIKVIGIGGGGNNVIKRLCETLNLDMELIAVNTDAKQLNSLADERIKKIQIGANLTRGLGCGGNIDKGREAAVNDYDALKNAVKGADMVFITAGLGGGTGTGATPVIAQAAHEMGILTVGVVTVPFKFEGARKKKSADAALAAMAPYMDVLIAVHNDNLLKIKTSTKLTFVNAFKMADSVLHQGIRCITELILTVGVINVDFADVKSIFQQSTSPDALLGIGESANGAVEAVNEAISSPLVERDLTGARGIILNLSGDKNMTLFEIDEASRYVHSHTHPDVNIILGTVVNEKLNGRVRATIIATDFADSELPAQDSGQDFATVLKSGLKSVKQADKTAVKTSKEEDSDPLKLPDFMNKF